MKDLMDPKYHYEWAKRGGNSAYEFIRDPVDGWPCNLQHRIPRFHIGLMADFAANRANGRFMYNNKADEGAPQDTLWDVIQDAHPENGDQMQGDVIGIGWRPHKGRETSQESRCLICKTTDTMLEYQYDVMASNPKGYDFSSPVVPMLKTINQGFNCNFCHDPHSAEPRIIFAPLIESMAGPDGKDNAYQKNIGSKAMTPIEVIDMGVRGFTRKVGYLEKPDANLMCAQCHVEYICNPGVDAKTGKAIGMDNRLTNHFPFVNADQIEAYYDKIGYRDFKHSMTGALLVKMQHPDAETFFGSKHDKAGATCASCHMPKVKDEKTGKVYTNHWATSPREYIEETCLVCHKDKTAKQMNAAIDAMHGYYDGKVRETEARMNDMFDAFEAAIAAGVDEKTLDEARKLHASAHINWEYWTAVNGAWFHNPDEAVRSLAKGAKAAQDATALLKKATAEKLAAK